MNQNAVNLLQQVVFPTVNAAQDSAQEPQKNSAHAEVLTRAVLLTPTAAQEYAVKESASVPILEINVSQTLTAAKELALKEDVSKIIAF
jgi:hypothetical protein